MAEDTVSIVVVSGSSDTYVFTVNKPKTITKKLIELIPHTMNCTQKGDAITFEVTTLKHYDFVCEELKRRNCTILPLKQQECGEDCTGCDQCDSPYDESSSEDSDSSSSSEDSDSSASDGGESDSYLSKRKWDERDSEQQQDNNNKKEKLSQGEE